MRGKSGAFGIVIATIAASVAQAAYFYPLLPDRVASHFGPTGEADGWMDKGPFLAVAIGTVAFIAALNTGIAAMLRHMPLSTINLPNREYWLAPERRDATLAWLQEHMHWMTAATNAFLLAVFQSAYLANLKPEPRLDGSFAWVLVAFVGFMLYWTVGMYRRFGRPRR